MNVQHDKVVIKQVLEAVDFGTRTHDAFLLLPLGIALYLGNTKFAACYCVGWGLVGLLQMVTQIVKAC